MPKKNWRFDFYIEKIEKLFFMLKKLENYYRHIGILSTEFSCEHLRECRGDSQNFTEAKSAFIGEQYGELNFPRLLFISSDPGSAKTDVSLETGEALISFASPDNRTPESVRRLVMQRVQLVRERKIKKPKSPRLRETNKIAFGVLRAFDSELAEESVMQFYAHANSVKCCENNSGSAEAKNKSLFRNCRGYLPGEIEILAPDVIVSLGKLAKEGAAVAFSDAVPEWGRLQIVTPKNGKEVLWLPLNHPSNYGEFYKQKKEWGPDWERFAKKIFAFMQKRKRD